MNSATFLNSATSKLARRAKVGSARLSVRCTAKRRRRHTIHLGGMIRHRKNLDVEIHPFRNHHRSCCSFRSCWKSFQSCSNIRYRSSGYHSSRYRSRAGRQRVGIHSCTSAHVGRSRGDGDCSHLLAMRLRFPSMQPLLAHLFRCF